LRRGRVNLGRGLDRLVTQAVAKAEAAIAEAQSLIALSRVEQNFRSGEAWLHMTATEQDDLIEILGWRRDEIECESANAGAQI